VLGIQTDPAFTGAVSATNAISIERSTANPWSTGFDVKKRGNTGGASNAVLANTELGYHGFYGWNGTGYSRGAMVYASTEQNFTAGAAGSRLSFYTTPLNSPDVTEQVRISPSGYVSTFNQPVFTATSTNSTTQGNDIVWNNVDYQVGSNYNSSNGRFTAPVTGYYQFHAHGLWGNADSGDRRIALYKNGAGFPGMRFITNKAANVWHTWFVDGVVYMAAGDYATIRIEQSSYGLHTDAGYNQFSGRLLG
jgi:hypothetical protein